MLPVILLLLAHTCQSSIVMIVGPTGAGKSTLINRLLNVNVNDAGHAPVSHQQRSCTTTCSSYHMRMGRVKVELIDTPGFPDTSSAEQGISNYNEIVQTINKRRPDVIIFLVKYGRWIRENEILQRYVILLEHFKRYGWYTVLATSWSAVDVTRVEQEFKEWQESIYDTLQQRVHGVHNIAAFGMSQHCTKELQRVISARRNTAGITQRPIPNVEQELQTIYNDYSTQVNQSGVRDAIKTAKSKQVLLGYKENTVLGSGLVSAVAWSVLPIGFPLLGVLGMSTCMAMWSGYEVVKTYQSVGILNRKDNLIKEDCVTIDMTLHNISKHYRMSLNKYLLNLQEITGLSQIDMTSLFYSENIHRLYDFLNTPCTDLVKN